jgi:hypothetical protein
MEDYDYVHDDSDEAWRVKYEANVDAWCEEYKRKPSYHPLIRYYCGYVEPLCKKLDQPEYKALAGFFMQDPLDLAKNDIDYTELHGIEWFDRLMTPQMHLYCPWLFDNESKPQSLHTLKNYNWNLWSHAVTQNLIHYDIISDVDRDYVDKCINKYGTSFILRVYMYHASNETFEHVYQRFMESMRKHYISFDGKQIMDIINKIMDSGIQK